MDSLLPSARETAEMILLTLARAEENGATLTRDGLARELNVSSALPLQSLSAESLIALDATGTLSLTPAGRERARALLRRHRLVERHLTDVLGLDWTRAHEQADQLEHTVSAAEEAALSAQLGNPDTCPHGNPIPGTRAAAPTAARSLAECAAQTRGVIARISTETPDALRHLATLGLLPNVAVVVENQAPFGGPVLVRVGHSHYALGRDLAARIWIDLNR
ncbi:MAG: metal-dependent transcriptional regulator [Chloroflexi bacterium]|nr:metal-dependent transcriptional regulator [Chloroflexota bacterium]